MRTHQPFESVDKAIHEDEDIASKSEYIYTAPQRILVRDTDEGGRKQALIRDLTAWSKLPERCDRAGRGAGNVTVEI